MDSHDNTSLRVASFSCYLDSTKENTIQRVSSQENLSQSIDRRDSLKNFRFSYPAGDQNFVFKVPKPLQDTSKDDEISVFGADRYFNMKLEYPAGLRRDFNKERHVNLTPVASQSVCSEASSFNSKTALIKNVEKTIISSSQTKNKKSIGRRFLGGFVCKGPCFDKTNVRINEVVTQGVQFNSKKIDNLGLISNPLSRDFTIKKLLEDEILEEARNSIEVFGSNANTSKGDHIATNLERKLSMLTWDAIPKGKIINSLPTSILGSSTICDDMASDASSDLFEIENISGSINQILKDKNVVINQDEEVSMCMSPASNYAPSEVSIQWSVVTASAADYSSILSDLDEKNVSISRKNVNKSLKTRNGGGKEAKSGSGGFLGCKNDKAVDVAETLCQKTKEKKVSIEGFGCLNHLPLVGNQL